MNEWEEHIWMVETTTRAEKRAVEERKGREWDLRGGKRSVEGRAREREREEERLKEKNKDRDRGKERERERDGRSEVREAKKD